MIIASKHFPRIATGAVLVGVLGTALYLSGPYLFGLLLLFTLVGLWEFYTMFWPLKANIGGRILGLALGGLLITAAWMRPEMVVMALALSTLILACMFLFCWAHDEKYRFTRVAVLAGGLLYVPMLIMPALNFSIHEQLLLICTAAGSDTVAYFFGMRFGKHKIWPKVSPKKSVEGSAAGLAASVAVAVCFGSHSACPRPASATTPCSALCSASWPSLGTSLNRRSSVPARSRIRAASCPDTAASSTVWTACCS